jgi:CubicO group peptidase (beta-lactamase class C family)
MGTSGDAKSAERFGHIREIIRAQMLEHGIPSVAVAVAQGDEILWEEGFGWANREARLAATPHTPYSLASISKPITTTGLMILVERGLIDLDRPVNDYLGDAKVTARVGDADDATVRRVADHTSGLPLHYHFFYEDEPGRPPMDETIRRYANLTAAPGQRPHYSNLGYGILDYVIERISAKPYADFMREEVFLPLGMTRSAIGIAPGLAPYAAARYAPDGLALPFYDFDHPGGSAVYASARDLLRFGMFHVKARLADQKRILSDESLDAMHEPSSNWPGGGAYGIGWRVDPDYGGYTLVSHSGGMGGVRTVLVTIPAERIVIVVLTNGSTSSPTVPYTLFADILPSLVPNLEGQADRYRAKQQAREEQKPPAYKPIPELLGEWQGTVHTHQRDLPLTLWFTDAGDIHARLGDDLRMLVNDAAYEDGHLTGTFPGDIGTPDASRRAHRLHLDLFHRGDVINGACTAITTRNDGSTPTTRAGNALSHWAEVRRSSGD